MYTEKFIAYLCTFMMMMIMILFTVTISKRYDVVEVIPFTEPIIPQHVWS